MKRAYELLRDYVNNREIGGLPMKEHGTIVHELGQVAQEQGGSPGQPEQRARGQSDPAGDEAQRPPEPPDRNVARAPSAHRGLLRPGGPAGLTRTLGDATPAVNGYPPSSRRWAQFLWVAVPRAHRGGARPPAGPPLPGA